MYKILNLLSLAIICFIDRNIERSCELSPIVAKIKILLPFIWKCWRNGEERGSFYLESVPRLYARVYACANADGAFVGTPNKKLAFTSAPRGRVLIRITRVRLLRGGRVLSSEPRPFPRERGKERTRGWKLIVKAPNTAMPNLEFLPYSSAYIRDLG